MLMIFFILKRRNVNLHVHVTGFEQATVGIGTEQVTSGIQKQSKCKKWSQIHVDLDSCR